MNLKTKKIQFIALISAILFSFGCQKDKEELNITSTTELVEGELRKEDMNKLLSYLSQLSQFPKNELYYNVENQGFYYKEVFQIHLRDLIVSYNQNSKN